VPHLAVRKRLDVPIVFLAGQDGKKRGSVESVETLDQKVGVDYSVLIEK